MIILRLPDSWSNWKLKVLVFEERRKPEYPEKNFSEQGREPTSNSTHIWRRRRDLNPGHIGFPKRKKQNKPLKSIDLVKRKFTAIKQFKIRPFRRVRASFWSRWVFLCPSQDEEVEWVSFPIRLNDANYYNQFQTCNLKHCCTFVISAYKSSKVSNQCKRSIVLNVWEF